MLVWTSLLGLKKKILGIGCKIKLNIVMVADSERVELYPRWTSVFLNMTGDGRMNLPILSPSSHIHGPWDTRSVHSKSQPFFRTTRRFTQRNRYVEVSQRKTRIS